MFEDLRSLYQEFILDHARHPRNFSYMSSANRQAKGHNPMCGDTLMVYATVTDSGKITDVSFLGKGCAISMASASIMTDMIKKRDTQTARTLFEGFQHICTQETPYIFSDPSMISDEEREKLEIMSGVRRFPVRVKCATLAWHTLISALDDQSTITTE